MYRKWAYPIILTLCLCSLPLFICAAGIKEQPVTVTVHTLPRATQPQHAPSPSRTKPMALKAGDCIGIVGPASPLDDPASLDRALTGLHERGYKTKLAPSATAHEGFFAGSDAQRAQDVNDFFRDASVQAILCLNGGYGSTHILNKLDYAMIAKHPKLFIGFSDITALHTALGQKSKLVTIHGPLVATVYSPYSSAYSTEQFDKGLTMTKAPGPLSLPAGRELQVLVAGTARGPIVGGNLTMLAALAGTPYELDGTGCILLLEDISEPSYRIDRMLEQLRQNGLFNRINGIIFGDFLDSEADPGDYTTDQVLAHYATLIGKPAIKNFPAGHGSDKAFLPFGVQAELQASENGHATVTIKEPYTM